MDTRAGKPRSGADMSGPARHRRPAGLGEFGGGWLFAFVLGGPVPALLAATEPEEHGA